MTATFQCRRCGNCCRAPGYVRLREGEAEALAAHLGLDERTFVDRFTDLTRSRTGLTLKEEADGRCVLLTEAGLCRVHAVKPRQCRDFPEGWNYAGYERICRGTR